MAKLVAGKPEVLFAICAYPCALAILMKKKHVDPARVRCAAQGTALMSLDPFRGQDPPKFVRAVRYKYTFAPSRWRAETPRGESATARERGTWWEREFVEVIVPPISRGDLSVKEFLSHHGLPLEW